MTCSRLKEAFLLLVFAAAVAAVHAPYYNAPHSTGTAAYHVTHSRWMLENATIFQPVDRDTGHPPLAFLSLIALWVFAGQSLLVGHAHQWLWGGALLLGMWKLGRGVHPGGQAGSDAPQGRNFLLLALLGVAILLIHPHLYPLLNMVLPDAPMAACYVWMLFGFYFRRPRVFGVASAALLLTKLNALPLAVAFAGFEFGLIPGLLAMRHRHQKRVLRVIWRWWIRWVAIAALAFLPFVGWLLLHRLHAGFWFQSEFFDVTTRFHADWAAAWRNLGRGGLWAILWWKGNRALFWVTFGLAVAGVAMRLTGGSGAGRWRPPGCLRPYPLLWLSMALQGVFIYGLHAFKTQSLQRYYVTVTINLVIGFLIAGGAMLAASPFDRVPAAPGAIRRLAPFLIAAAGLYVMIQMLLGSYAVYFVFPL